MFREKINLHFPSFSSRIIKGKKIIPYLSVVAMPEVCLPRFAFNLYLRYCRKLKTSEKSEALPDTPYKMLIQS